MVTRSPCYCCHKSHNTVEGKRRCHAKTIREADEKRQAEVESTNLSKPCPFCGYRFIYAGFFKFSCPKCGAIGPGGADLEQSQKLWNMRGGL